ncbi:MAG: DNA/RNA non-specific endonuclease [Prevotella sp.]|nr:DNA/RNA non-specific endonuclease [Prevotella sp.]
MAVATLLCSACSSDGGDVVIRKGQTPTNGNLANDNRNTTGPQEARWRYEFPRLKGGGDTVIVHKTVLNKNTRETGVNYSIEWSPARNAQRWSCYQMYSSINYHSSYNVSRYYADNDGSLSASCQYPADADLPVEFGFDSDPYKYSGYDHGHICPSADRLRSSESNYQTFFITNMHPQYRDFNGSNSTASINERSPWYRLETLVRTWAEPATSDTLYVCKGGTIDSDANIIEYIKNGSKKTTPAAGYVPVPRYFFMAMLSRKGNAYQAVGFWMEHASQYAEKKPLTAYAMSIDQLEFLTGIDFFCNLPDSIESVAERAYTATYWTGL